MSVPSSNTSVTCDKPKRDSERNSVKPAMPPISVSMGNVTSFSISSGASAGTCVLICTWTLVMSGTASIGSRNADHTPMPTRMNVAKNTNARWRTENSSKRASMFSLCFSAAGQGSSPGRL